MNYDNERTAYCRTWVEVSKGSSSNAVIRCLGHGRVFRVGGIVFDLKAMHDDNSLLRQFVCQPKIDERLGILLKIRGTAHNMVTGARCPHITV